jgi:hypothetical protein
MIPRINVTLGDKSFRALARPPSQGYCFYKDQLYRLGNSLDLYSRDGRFESRQGHRLSWLSFSLFHSIPQSKCRDRFKNLFQFICDPIIWCYIRLVCVRYWKRRKTTQWCRLGSILRRFECEASMLPLRPLYSPLHDRDLQGTRS